MVLIGIIGIFLIGLVYRIYGIFDNHPLWVDEFSTAAQAQLVIKHGLNVLNNPLFHFESHNITSHFIVAFFIRIFGNQEWVIRAPYVLIGALVPVSIFLLARRLYNPWIGLSAALFSVFSYIQITWSRQARSYVLVQLLTIMSMYFYIKIIKKENVKFNTLLLMLFLVIGILTHITFGIIILSIGVHYIIANHKLGFSILKNNRILFGIALILIVFFTSGLSDMLYSSYIKGFRLANNVWYYHSFLWREYSLITFLGLTGLIIGLLRSKFTLLIIIFCTIQLIVVSFFLLPYTSRYLFIIFPFLFIGMSVVIHEMSEFIFRRYKILSHSFLFRFMPLLIVLGIIINGHKFVIKPKQYYSVNHDFREIALIDYNEVYDIIRVKGNLKEQKTAVIDTWNARTYWYIGTDYEPTYIFRWLNNSGLTNGLPQKTEYTLTNSGEKVLPRAESRLRLIGEMSDLKKAMAIYPKGFIFIDDATLPDDVRKYAEENFKKELYLDHYPLDDNPYSVWPATLYSWGI